MGVYQNSIREPTVPFDPSLLCFDYHMGTYGSLNLNVIKMC